MNKIFLYTYAMNENKYILDFGEKKIMNESMNVEGGVTV